MKKLLISFSSVFLILMVGMAALFTTSKSPSLEAQEVTSAILNQRISYLFEKETTKIERRRPYERQYPRAYQKCATPLIRMAMKHADLLSPKNLFVLYRPDNPQYIRFYSPDSKTLWTYDTPEGHFKIHYRESGTDAVFGSDGLQDTLPNYVIDFGSYFEQSWEYEVNYLGYNSPPPDRTYGGDSRFDVYLLNINSYGYTAIEREYAYIVAHNSYHGFSKNLDPEGSRAGNMKVTAAHEFFHAIQYIYDDWNNDSIWWEENTAVLMEDKVFDYVDDYLRYLGNPFDDQNGNYVWDPGETWYQFDGSVGGITGKDLDVWFEAPEISLDSVDGLFEYGGVMWAKYLEARFSHQFIKESFIIADWKKDALTALQEILPTYGTDLPQTFADFRVQVLILDSFEEASHYPLVHHQGNYQAYPLDLSLNGLSHLSCRYINLESPEGKKILTLQFDGQDFAHLALAIVLFKDSGYDVSYLEMDDCNTQTGSMEIASFGREGEYYRLTLIPMNLSPYQNKQTLSLSATAEESPSDAMTINMELPSGWSLISLPVEPVDRRVSKLFDSAVAVFKFADKYILLDPNEELEIGKGYWLYLPSAHSYSITGKPIDHYVISKAQAGWTMIGSSSYSSIPEAGHGSIMAVFQFTNNKYVLLDSDYYINPLAPGKGFWIYLSKETDLKVEPLGQ